MRDEKRLERKKYFKSYFIEKNNNIHTHTKYKIKFDKADGGWKEENK